MYKIIKNTFLLLLLLAAETRLAKSQQNTIADSLINIIKISKDDTNKIKHYLALNEILAYQNPDSAIHYMLKACELSKKLKNRLFEAKALGELGWNYYASGNYENALISYEKALAIAKKIKNKYLEASNYNHIGSVNYAKGDFSKALTFYYRAMTIAEEIKNQNLISANLGCIGAVQVAQEDYDKALTTFLEALKVTEPLKDNYRIATYLGNIGLVYNEQKDFTKALEYIYKAVELNESLGNKMGVAKNIGSIALIYSQLKNYTKAIEHYEKAIKLNKEVGNLVEYAVTLTNVGRLYTKMGNYQTAEIALKESLKLFHQIGVNNYLKMGHLHLSMLYDTTNRHKLALLHYKNYIIMRDSISNEENTKKQTQLEMQYIFDKKHATDSIKNNARIKQEEYKHNLEIKQQKIYTYGGIIGFALMLVVAAVSFRAFRNKQKANLIIAEQKNMVEEKQKEILDSIHYAKRIQVAMLTSEKYIERNFKKYLKK